MDHYTLRPRSGTQWEQAGQLVQPGGGQAGHTGDQGYQVCDHVRDGGSV